MCLSKCGIACYADGVRHGVKAACKVLNLVAAVTEWWRKVAFGVQVLSADLRDWQDDCQQQPSFGPAVVCRVCRWALGAAGVYQVAHGPHSACPGGLLLLSIARWLT
jgi:hypothetical protein